MTNLGPTNDNINIDGSIVTYTDFGGDDTYTILPSLSGDVTVTDVQGGTINLPDTLDISAVRFLADGVEFTLNGFTVTFLGAPSDASFVFGGTPLNPSAGTALSFEETAAAFGTSVPALGEASNTATQLGMINADGTVGDGAPDLPENPGITSADGIFFESVSFQTDTGDETSTAQGLSELGVSASVNGFSTSGNAEFIVRNADLTVGNDIGATGGTGHVFSFSGPSTEVSFTGTTDGNSSLRIAASDGRSTEGTVFVSDGAQVVLDSSQQDRNSAIYVGANFGPFDGGVAGQSADGTLIVEGEGTTLSILNSLGGDRGFLQIGGVFNSDTNFDEVTINRTAEGLMIVRDGAEVNIRQFIGIAESSKSEGAEAKGTMIIEGEGTRVTVGNPDGTTENAFMLIADDGGEGELIIRDGAELLLLDGNEFGAGLRLGGQNDNPGGEADVTVTGAGSRLFAKAAI